MPVFKRTKPVIGAVLLIPPVKVNYKISKKFAVSQTHRYHMSFVSLLG